MCIPHWKTKCSSIFNMWDPQIQKPQVQRTSCPVIFHVCTSEKNRKTQPSIISESRRGFWGEGRWREEVGHSLIHPLQEYLSTSVPWSLSLSLCKSLTQKRKWINALDTAKRKPMPWTTGLEKLDHIIVRNGGRNLEWGHRGDTWHTSDLSSREREQEIREKVILNEDGEERSRNEKSHQSSGSGF